MLRRFLRFTLDNAQKILNLKNYIYRLFSPNLKYSDLEEVYWIPFLTASAGTSSSAVHFLQGRANVLTKSEMQPSMRCIEAWH
jgi:hypothetical protein